MKIFKDGEVYVQAFDIAEINSLKCPYPSSIHPERFKGKDYICYDSNSWVFYKFSNPVEVNYFKMADWILDYNDIKDKSIKELDAMWSELHRMRIKNRDSFMDASSEERLKMDRDYVYEMHRLFLMQFDIELVYSYKQNKIKIEFPFEIEELDKEKPVIKKKTIKKDVE